MYCLTNITRIFCLLIDNQNKMNIRYLRTALKAKKRLILPNELIYNLIFTYQINLFFLEFKISQKKNNNLMTFDQKPKENCVQYIF